MIMLFLWRFGDWEVCSLECLDCVLGALAISGSILLFLLLFFNILSLVLVVVSLTISFLFLAF